MGFTQAALYSPVCGQTTSVKTMDVMGFISACTCATPLSAEAPFTETAWHGIGGLDDGGDQYNVVANNTCVRNARRGIEASCGQNNTISSNICLNNSQAIFGKYSGIGMKDVTGTMVNGNQCLDDQSEHTQAYGIEETEERNENFIVSNHCRGKLIGGAVTIGADIKYIENLE